MTHILVALIGVVLLFMILRSMIRIALMNCHSQDFFAGFTGRAVYAAAAIRLRGTRDAEATHRVLLALYPDPLVGEVLVASTYPFEIAEAEQWIHDHIKWQSEQKCASLFCLPGRRKPLNFVAAGEVFNSPGGAPVATVVFGLCGGRRARSWFSAAERAEGGTGSGKRRAQSSAIVRSDGCGSFSSLLGGARNRSGYGRRVWSGLLCSIRFTKRADRDPDRECTGPDCGFDGIVAVRGAGKCASRSFRSRDSAARRGCRRARRQPRHHHPRHSARSTLPVHHPAASAVDPANAISNHLQILWLAVIPLSTTASLARG